MYSILFGCVLIVPLVLGEILIGTSSTTGNTKKILTDDSGNLQVAIKSTDTVSTDLTAIKTAVEIMDDWDESDRAKVNPIVGQAGVAAGSGVNGATVQRVTVATDDTVATDLTAIKTAVQIVDDWDHSDSDKANVFSRPLEFEADVASNCVAITNASVQFTLPTSPATDWFKICAYDNESFLLFGSNPTATTTVTTGYSMRVKDGQCIGPMAIADAKVAVIGTVTAGAVCFMHFQDPL